MRELSIFIDESGDFGEVKERPTYYLVTMVFHNQAIDITKEIERLEERQWIRLHYQSVYQKKSKK